MKIVSFLEQVKVDVKYKPKAGMYAGKRVGL